MKGCDIFISDFCKALQSFRVVLQSQFFFSVPHAYLLYNKLTQYKHFKDLPPIPGHLNQIEQKCKNLEENWKQKKCKFQNTIPVTFTRTLIVNNPKTAPEAPTETVFLGKISQETRFAPTPVRM